MVWYGDDFALVFQFRFKVIVSLVVGPAWCTGWGGLVQEMICKRVGKMKSFEENAGQI